MKATNTAKLEHRLRDPARTVDIVPSLADNTLTSASKFADANYISIYDPEEVNIYDGKTTKLSYQRKQYLKVIGAPSLNYGASHSRNI